MSESALEANYFKPATGEGLERQPPGSHYKWPRIIEDQLGLNENRMPDMFKRPDTLEGKFNMLAKRMFLLENGPFNDVDLRRQTFTARPLLIRNVEVSRLTTYANIYLGLEHGYDDGHLDYIEANWLIHITDIDFRENTDPLARQTVDRTRIGRNRDQSNRDLIYGRPAKDRFKHLNYMGQVVRLYEEALQIKRSETGPRRPKSRRLSGRQNDIIKLALEDIFK